MENLFLRVTDPLVADSNAAEVSLMLQLRFLPVIALLTNIFMLAPSSTSAAQTAKADRTPVLVELFTSEGCSSCPPADALLAKLDRIQPVAGAEIIVLGEHVDYWDEDWHDRFSSHQYTERQNQYSSRLHFDSAYTPQMIVDGTDQFVGNDGPHALRAIQHAAQTAKLPLTLSRPVVDGNRISATVSTTAPPAAQLHGDLYAALVDPTDTTDVRHGENRGHQLQHVGVVRVMQRIGSLKDLGAPREFSLTAPANAVPTNMRVVVFAQNGGQGAVLGAVSTSVTP